MYIAIYIYKRIEPLPHTLHACMKSIYLLFIIHAIMILFKQNLEQEVLNIPRKGYIIMIRGIRDVDMLW